MLFLLLYFPSFLNILFASCLSVIAEPVTCPRSWIHIQNSCYQLSSQKLVWSEATSACKALGANLAVVKSEHEQLGLASAVSHVTWIGLKRDSENTSTWRWVDGSNAAETRWAKGQPNNHGGNEDCVAITGQQNRKWNDFNCDTPEYYVCQKSGKSVMSLHGQTLPCNVTNLTEL